MQPRLAPHEQQGSPHNSASRGRCTRSRRAGQRLPIQPTLLRSPFSQPSLHFSVAHHTASFGVVEALLNLLPHVDVVLNIFQGCVLGKHLENALNLILGALPVEILTCAPPKTPPAGRRRRRCAGTYGLHLRLCRSAEPKVLPGDRVVGPSLGAADHRAGQAGAGCENRRGRHPDLRRRAAAARTPRCWRQAGSMRRCGASRAQEGSCSVFDLRSSILDLGHGRG